MDYVHYWTGRAELSAKQLLGWLEHGQGKFHTWKGRYGKVNEHNGQIPRDHWLEDWEQAAIIDFHDRHPLEVYRRLTFMMLDDDVVAVSPASVYRVLKGAGRLDRKWAAPSKKGTGFAQPLQPHEHGHIDVSYINVEGTFDYLTSVLDGASRSIVHWELRESMTEQDIEVILQKALEQHPGEKPRIISDNGPQFIARDFQEFIRLVGITHVRTSPYYPQSNGKLESWHGSLKRECLRPKWPASLEEARRRVAAFVEHYNQVRLHSAIGYITPADKLNGLEQVIFAERDRKLEEARHRRQLARQRAGTAGVCLMHGLPAQSISTWAEDRAPLSGTPANGATARSDPSAVPGVGVDDRAGFNSGSVSLPPLQRQCEKPSRHDAATLGQDVATVTH